MSNKISFKLKLIFSYLFIIFITFSFIVFFLDKNLEENSLQNIKSSLLSQAILIGNQISPDKLKNEDLSYLETLVKTLGQKINVRITIVDNQGKVLSDSERTQEEVFEMGNHKNRPEIKSALDGNVGVDTHRSVSLKMDMLYVALTIRDKGDIVGAVRLSLPLTDIQKTLLTIRKIVLIGLFFALGLAFVLSSIVASQIIKPINKMIHVSHKFSNGDFSRRIIHSSKDEIGELAATLNKMAQDIEDKIKEIKTKNQQLEGIFNSMIEGVIVVDKKGQIVSINQTIEKIFAVTKKTVEGKVFLESIRNNDISEVIHSVLQKGESLSSEVTLLFPKGKVFEVNATPILDENKVAGCLVVIHDITEIRKLETVRQDFVANVSHELKTPLTSIKGFVETLLEGALDDKENNRNFLKIIHDHTERLNNLVNDLLSLSCLESKEITLKRTSVNLREQLEKVIPGFKSQLKRMNIEISNELGDGLLIQLDQNRIEQVFTNLIDNAIKFNKEKGYIKIYGQEINERIKVIIEDSGIGIPEKDVPRIFERFYRVDKARSRELGGTGLGLSIVKHVIELHGGSVGVESTEGLGSKFWFILPK